MNTFLSFIGILPPKIFAFFYYLSLNYKINYIWGREWWYDSESKGVIHQAWWPEFDQWEPHDRRSPTLKSYAIKKKKAEYPAPNNCQLSVVKSSCLHCLSMLRFCLSWNWMGLMHAVTTPTPVHSYIHLPCVMKTVFHCRPPPSLTITMNLPAFQNEP